MKITWGLVNATFSPRTVTTLGSYDGMHCGHIEILKHLIAKQNELASERSLVITFAPHPQQVLRRSETTVELLTTIEERLELLEATGVSETLVIKFSLEFARTPYENFFNNILINSLGTGAMVVGFNHAFGKNREGDTAHLKDLASRSGISVEEVPPLILQAMNVSSTKIRHALLEGDVKTAREFLGHDYTLTGKVIHGEKKGRDLGYPTAN
ncbi:MAG: riboflavin kinase, partial [Ignavibacteriota bacterium]